MSADEANMLLQNFLNTSKFPVPKIKQWWFQGAVEIIAHCFHSNGGGTCLEFSDKLS